MTAARPSATRAARQPARAPTPLAPSRPPTDPLPSWLASHLLSTLPRSTATVAPKCFERFCSCSSAMNTSRIRARQLRRRESARRHRVIEHRARVAKRQPGGRSDSEPLLLALTLPRDARSRFYHQPLVG